jgi:hypothetical protein
MTYRNLIAALAALLVSSANAGITIYYKGRLLDEAAMEKVSETACAEAGKNGWQCERLVGDQIAKADGITAKSIYELEKTQDLSGARGVVLRLHPMSEPLYLVFSKGLRINNFVKTQFAGAEVHVRAIELLEKIKPHFSNLEVEDDSGYWESRNRGELEREIQALNAILAKIKGQRTDIEGPVKRIDGRILDLVSK